MGTFQMLMTAGSEVHRRASGSRFIHKPFGGPDQRLWCSLTRIVEMFVQDESGSEVIEGAGVLLIIRSEMTSLVTRFSKFVDEEGQEYNYNDAERMDTQGVYLEVPLKWTKPIRKGPGENYQQNIEGR